MSATPLHPYDHWAPCYPPSAHNPLMTAEEGVMRKCLVRLRPSRVLDLGAGTGRYGAWMRTRGVPLIVSLDLSMGMLQTHPAGSRLRVRGDGRQLPFEAGAFDLVIAGLVAGDIPALSGWCGEVRRALQPGGTFVYSDFHPDWHARGWRRTFTDLDGRSHELPLSPHTEEDHHAALAEAGFRCLSVDEVMVTPPESRRSGRRPAPGPVPALLVVAGEAV